MRSTTRPPASGEQLAADCHGSPRRGTHSPQRDRPQQQCERPARRPSFVPVRPPRSKKFVETLKAKFADYNLTYSIGGQISFDVFPQARPLVTAAAPAVQAC